MSLNWKEIDCILSELQLPGCFIQKIRQPDFATLILEVFRPGGDEPPAGRIASGRFRLLISMEQNKTRLHATGEEPPSSGGKLQRFAQFLRSRMTGGRIEDARQLGDDRIVRLAVRRAGEVTVLWIRLWGGAANVIACDESGTILDAFYRRPKRGEISGGFFAPDIPAGAGDDIAAGTTQIRKGKKKKDFEIRELSGTGSFNGKIADFYAGTPAGPQGEGLRADALANIEQEIRKTSSRLAAAEQNVAEAESFEVFKQYADLIMSNMHALQPGSQWLRCENYYTGGEVEIALTPSLSPERNAEAYYDRYKKEKARFEHEQARVQALRTTLADLQKKRTRLEELEDPDTAEAASLLRPVEKSPVAKKTNRAGRSRETIPGLCFRSAEFIILVGRTAKENDELLRHHVKGNDLWLHTRDYAGGYVFVKSIPGKSVPLDTLLDAGNLALFYSKGRSGGKGELYYTQVKYLRRAKDGKRGLVLPTREKNLSITLDRPRLDRLFGAEETES